PESDSAALAALAPTGVPPPRRRRRAALLALPAIGAAVAAAVLAAGSSNDPEEAPPQLQGTVALGSALSATGVASVDCSGRPPNHVEACRRADRAGRRPGACRPPA